MKSGWTIKCLGEITEVLDSLRKPVTKSDRKSGPYPYYGASGVQDFVDSYPFDGRYLLVGEDGAKWGAGDKSAYIIEGKSWVNNHAHILKVRNSISDKYLEYYLVFSDLNEYITGAVVPKLTQKALCTIPIPIPPIEEQQRIVDELDLLTGIIDKKNAQLRDLDALTQSIFYEMFGDPIINDKGWPKRMLKQLGLVITGNTPSTKDVKNYASEDVCFFKPSDICKDSVSFLKKSEFHISSYAFEKSRKLPKGSVLTTCIGIVGKVGILTKSATCNQQINAIIPENVESPWLAYAVFLQKKLMEEIANAPVVPIINKGDFSRIQVPVPPIEKQEQFSQALKEIECQKQMILLSKSETEKLLSCRMASYFG
jgi:type I restriction enzyme S subunit